MRSQFERLIDNMRRAKDAPPADLAAALAALPGVGQLPPPWVTWLAIVLARLLRRQRWAKALVQEQVLDDLPPLEDLSEDDEPLHGALPGSPDWEYAIEPEFEIGHLTNLVTGESIMFNLSEAEALDCVYVPDFMQWFGPLEPGSPEVRLHQLHPSPETVVQSVELLSYDLQIKELDILPEQNPYALTGATLEHADLLAAFGDAWTAATGPQRIWLAALAGDWLAADDAAVVAGDPALVAVTGGRKKACLARQAALLRLEVACKSRDALTMLDELGDPHAKETLKWLREAATTATGGPGSL